MKVRMSYDARAYLRDEAKYLRKRSPAAARTLTAVMKKARENLANFGELGFTKEGLPIPGMRRLIVGNYLLGLRNLPRRGSRRRHSTRAPNASRHHSRRRF